MGIQDESRLKEWLDERVLLYNQPGFIPADPICIPHQFSRKQDMEIAAFFAATLAWGNRTTIINNCQRLLKWMDDAPYEFMRHHQASDLKPMLGFVHRTFNATDLLYFIQFLQIHYQHSDTLETAFLPPGNPAEYDLRDALIHFHNQFFTGEYPERTRKHVSTPQRGSACKRLCMFLRWMVRKDSAGVDFGIWNGLSPAQLICPLDVHVARVAYRLGLTSRQNADWRSATELTGILKTWRPEDPAIYDYALFGLGMAEGL